MMTTDEMDPCGALLGNRYHLEERIGGGSAAMVYRATDRRTGGKVAVKVLHPDHVPDDSEVRRFVQEAQLGAQIRHPNIVRSHDFGGLGGWHYIVMELVEGKSLAHCTEANKVDPVRSARLMLDLLAAVGALHDQGIVHRDISPSNVLVESVDGCERARLADLGIARKLSDCDLALTDVPPTKPAHSWGTTGYIAPECIRGCKNDYLADIYSAGAVWYKMVTGFPPASLREGEPGDWPKLVHKLENMAPAMRAVLLGALAPRDKRHHSAASMAAALRVAMKARRSRSRPTFVHLLTPALAVLFTWASLDSGADERLDQPAKPAAQLDQPAEPTAQLDQPAEPAAQLDQPAEPAAQTEPAAQLDQPAEPATPGPGSARATVLASTRPRRKPLPDALREALARCKSPKVDLEVVLEPGGDVEVNGAAPFGDLGRCVRREVTKLPPPSKRLVVTL